MKYAISLLAVIVVLSGCAGSPFQLARMDREQLSTVTDEQLIRALENRVYKNDLMFEEAMSRGLFTNKQLIGAIGGRIYRIDMMLEEAKSRGLFTDEEIKLIKEKKIRIGMSEEALIASWGSPRKVNRSVGRYGVHKQYVYGSHSGYSTPTYVYVENGKVTSWQD